MINSNLRQASPLPTSTRKFRALTQQCFKSIPASTGQTGSIGFASHHTNPGFLVYTEYGMSAPYRGQATRSDTGMLLYSVNEMVLSSTIVKECGEDFCVASSASSLPSTNYIGQTGHVLSSHGRPQRQEQLTYSARVDGVWSSREGVCTYKQVQFRILR